MIALQEHIAEIEVSYRPRLASGDMPVINRPEDAYEVLFPFFPSETIALQERFIVGYLNRANRVIGVYEASIGGMTGTVADIRLIFTIGLKIAAQGIIVCHNHPSGQLKPSNADESLTERIREAGKLLEIPLLDHLIVAPSGGFYSFTENETFNK